MRPFFLLAAATLAIAGPVHAQTPTQAPAQSEADLEKGFAGALRGCEEWVFNPGSWSNGPAPFLSAVGLGDKMRSVDKADDLQLPPPALRAGDRYWRIDSTPDAGFMLIVSDQLPMCHITGGGNADLQPAITAVITSAAFSSRWTLIKQEGRGELQVDQFQNVKEPSLALVVSQPAKPGQRKDKVQVIATALLQVGQ